MSDRPRPLGSGARVRLDRSLTADAQRRYRAEAGQDHAPRADAGREPTGRAADKDIAHVANQQAEPAATEAPLRETQGTVTVLTQRAQALYEAGVVPMRALARLCGVSLRTFYYHVHKQGWRRRRSAVPRDRAKSERQRRRYQALKALQPLRPRGLKARDQDGGAAALAATERAAELSGVALKRAIAARDAELGTHLLWVAARAVRESATAEDGPVTRRARTHEREDEEPEDMDAFRRNLARRLDIACGLVPPPEVAGVAGAAEVPDDADEFRRQLAQRIEDLAAREQMKAAAEAAAAEVPAIGEPSTVVPPEIAAPEPRVAAPRAAAPSQPSAADRRVDLITSRMRALRQTW